MKTRLLQTVLVLLFTALLTVPSFAQQAKEDAVRADTREKMRAVLAEAGPKLNIDFHQSQKQPFNFVGTLSTGLTNSDSLEVVVSVTASSTVAFRVYPHYKGGYINVTKAADGPGLMHKLLQMCNTNFLYWGSDDADDVFAGYTITLESGFPTEAVKVVLRSIPNQDEYVGQLKSFVDPKP